MGIHDEHDGPRSVHNPGRVHGAEVRTKSNCFDRLRHRHVSSYEHSSSLYVCSHYFSKYCNLISQLTVFKNSITFFTSLHKRFQDNKEAHKRSKNRHSAKELFFFYLSRSWSNGCLIFSACHRYNFFSMIFCIDLFLCSVVTYSENCTLVSGLECSQQLTASTTLQGYSSSLTASCLAWALG